MIDQVLESSSEVMKEKSHNNQRRIPSQARAKKKYDAVLAACTQVLTTQGYANATMMELSLESGVAVPTIYQYFENKEAIFLAWINGVIDKVLSQVSTLERGLDNQPLEQYVKVLIRGALIMVASYSASIQQMLQGIPKMLSSQVVASMEEKTVVTIESLFDVAISNANQPDMHFKIQTLVRLMTGYFLQALANTEREIDIDKESEELSLIVTLYLQGIGLNSADEI